MTFALSFSSLLMSVILLQLGSGALGPLDVLSGLHLNFNDRQIGLLGSFQFLGFFVGCWWGPRLIGQIGHSRSFAVFASAGTIGILLHMIIIDPNAWVAMRMLTGLSIAGCITVIEAWMQAKVDNKSRGRKLGLYRIVDLAGSGLAQLMITLLSPGHYIAYNILAIICCASLLPLVMTRIPPPTTSAKLRLRPILAYSISPMATACVIVAGITNAGFRMVGPLYAHRIGLEVTQIGIFLALYILGGALSQYPAGWLADKFDRRRILIIFSFASILASLITIVTSANSIPVIYGCSILFGFTTFPIYSVAAAHANDFSPRDRMVELSASLLFFYAVGAIFSPYLFSGLIESYGSSAMFVAIAAVHALLVIIGFIRMTIGPESSRETSYVYTPRTSFLIGRLIRRNRDSK